MASRADPADGRSGMALAPARPINGVTFGGQPARDKVREYVTLASTKWAGTLIALWWVFTRPTGWTEWSCFIVTYLLGIFGMTIAYHRYFSHRAFETSRPMQYVLAILAQTCAQGSLLRWASDHRRHHGRTDRHGDPHSPYCDAHGTPLAKWKGIGHAHFGWCLDKAATDLEVYGKGLVDDPVVMWAHRTKWFWYVVSTVIIPALWGWVFGGTLEAVVGTVLVGGFLRINFVLHATLAVNSFGHTYGYQTYSDGHSRARNNWVLAILTLGDGWHNNHHEHPRSAFTSEKWWELDISGGVIRLMEMLGLVWAVQRTHKPAGDV